MNINTVKIGDEVICISDISSFDINGTKGLTIGKKYKVMDVWEGVEHIMIKNDVGMGFYYEIEMFDTLSNIRKNKILKLK